MMLQATIRQWDGHLGICLPDTISSQINLKDGMNVAIELVDGVIMIRPVHPNYHLDDLLAGITDDNQHESIDPNNHVGQEAW